jgi:aspartate dehydrogenase
MSSRYRVGMVGHGFIGRSLYRSFAESAVDIVSVYDQLEANIADLSAAVATADAETFLERLDGLDLVVEVAHPDVSAQIGRRILDKTSYMPCSVVALADESLRNELLACARRAGTKLYLPHGAVVGMDNLLEAREMWQSVTITFRKPPASIDASCAAQADETLLFEGSVREIAGKYPRSVNAMVACALATVGLDATRARMFADRRLGNVLRGEFEFVGVNGSRLTIVKEEPGVGVSGVGMVNSIRGSVLRALGVSSDEPIFV